MRITVYGQQYELVRCSNTMCPVRTQTSWIYKQQHQVYEGGRSMT